VTIFVITSGSYSGYQILGVYTDRALAEAVVASRASAPHNGDDPRIEEFEANAPVANAMATFWVRSCPGSIAVQSARFEDAPREALGKVSRYAEIVFVSGANDWLSVHVQARDAQHAVKIAADLFREFVATTPAAP
jgi:hypothetical protein